MDERELSNLVDLLADEEDLCSFDATNFTEEERQLLFRRLGDHHLRGGDHQKAVAAYEHGLDLNAICNVRADAIRRGLLEPAEAANRILGTPITPAEYIAVGDKCFENGRIGDGLVAYGLSGRPSSEGGESLQEHLGRIGSELFKEGKVKAGLVVDTFVGRIKGPDELREIGDGYVRRYDETSDAKWLGSAFEVYARLKDKQDLIRIGDRHLENSKFTEAGEAYAAAGHKEGLVKAGEGKLEWGFVNEGVLLWKLADKEITQEELIQVGNRQLDLYRTDKMTERLWFASDAYVRADHNEGLIRVGENAIEASQLETAVEVFGRARNTAGLVNVGNLLLAQGQLDKAFGVFRKASDKEGLGRVGDAYFDRYESSKPPNPELLIEAMRAYGEKGDTANIDIVLGFARREGFWAVAKEAAERLEQFRVVTLIEERATKVE